MKIIKFIKQKDNRYKLKFDDREDVILYDDLIIKYNLLSHKEIDEDTIDKYIEENKYLVLSSVSFHTCPSFITLK